MSSPPLPPVNVTLFEVPLSNHRKRSWTQPPDLFLKTINVIERNMRHYEAFRVYFTLTRFVTTIPILLENDIHFSELVLPVSRSCGYKMLITTFWGDRSSIRFELWKSYKIAKYIMSAKVVAHRPVYNPWGKPEHFQYMEKRYYNDAISPLELDDPNEHWLFEGCKRALSCKSGHVITTITKREWSPPDGDEEPWEIVLYDESIDDLMPFDLDKRWRQTANLDQKRYLYDLSTSVAVTYPQSFPTIPWTRRVFRRLINRLTYHFTNVLDRLGFEQWTRWHRYIAEKTTERARLATERRQNPPPPRTA